MPPEQRRKHIEEFKAMLCGIENALNQALEAGVISEGDYVKLADLIGSLYHYLYSNMKDLEEVDHMVEEKFVSLFDQMAEKIRKNSKQEGIREGMQQGMQQGMRVTQLLVKKTNLTDEELNEKTGCDIEYISQIRPGLIQIN